MPAVTRQIIAALDSAAPTLKQNALVVSSQAACPPSPGVVSQNDQKVIGDYFSKYYLDKVEVAVSGRLTIGANFIGYLLDVPGMYSLSVVDLWTYDVANNKWLKPMELSEDWGDAGDYYYSDSLLVDVDGDGYKDIVKRGKHGNLEMDADRPARVIFDTTVLRKFTRSGFRNSGTAPRLLKDRLLTLENKLDCQ
ncbi:MAG TPA: hypothetical protein VL754_05975 [Verrucomicrobiae bacterium]|jgi:hypothetical protein|nr:hypothetical protein [Verrucomicrobiae bacterium]